MQQLNMRNTRRAFIALRAAVLELERDCASLRKELEELKKQRLAAEPKKKN